MRVITLQTVHNYVVSWVAIEGHLSLRETWQGSSMFFNDCSKHLEHSDLVVWGEGHKPLPIPLITNGVVCCCRFKNIILTNLHRSTMAITKVVGTYLHDRSTTLLRAMEGIDHTKVKNNMNCNKHMINTMIILSFTICRTICPCWRGSERSSWKLAERRPQDYWRLHGMFVLLITQSHIID